MLREIISASRRTDLPRWFLPEVLRWFKQQFVDVPNPFSRKLYRVVLAPEAVHSIVWWSKDFSRWLEQAPAFDAYINTFQFTINADRGTFLEPGLTSTLDERIAQFRILADQYGVEALNWRFDPIVFWNNGHRDNLAKFACIAEQLAQTGITRMTFSFATWYGKCVKRAQQRDFRYCKPTKDRKVQTLAKLAKLCVDLGIEMRACCDPDIGQFEIDNVVLGQCIDEQILNNIAGIPATTQHHSGQRQICRCTRSRDIGRYDYACKHRCVYCYANPEI